MKLKLFRMKIQTKLLDRLIFNGIRNKVMGNQMKILLCGGAILRQEVQEFSQIVLCSIIQAYGLTETSGGGTLQFPTQNESGNF